MDQDRRVRRTRRALHEALIALVLDKGYERITVQDVLDRADIGRSTFYAHYRDKEALLLASFDDVRDQLQQEVDATKAAGDPIDPTRPAELIFEHAHRNQRVYRALCGRQGGQAVYGHLHRMVGDLLLETLRPQPDLPPDLVVEFYTSATLGLLTWWIDHDFTRGPAWLATTYRQLAGTGQDSSRYAQTSVGQPHVGGAGPADPATSGGAARARR